MKKMINDARNVVMSLTYGGKSVCKNIANNINISEGEITKANELLRNLGYVKDYINSNFEYSSIQISFQGVQWVEKIRKQERWDYVMRACDNCNCYNIDYINLMLDKRLEEETKKWENEN